jgi:hypothetical protein
MRTAANYPALSRGADALRSEYQTTVAVLWHYGARLAEASAETIIRQALTAGIPIRDETGGQ